MRTRSRTPALAALVLIGTFASTTRAAAQDTPAKADSAPHFSLFGGWAPIDGGYVVKRGLALGGSGDFRVASIPVPLRLSLAFNERTGEYITRQRGGQASLDLVFRPIPKFLGLRPYFLGGLGVATQTAFAESRTFYYMSDGEMRSYYSYRFQPRQTWAYASGGVGLDVGRAFIQMKFAMPVASEGPTLIPISVGFRFWD